MSCTDPPLTTVRQPIEAIGRAAVEMLVGQIEGSSDLGGGALLRARDRRAWLDREGPSGCFALDCASMTQGIGNLQNLSRSLAINCRLCHSRRRDAGRDDRLADALAALEPTRAPGDRRPERPWWRDAVVYQVYVRSFADGNGDGTGDLAGVRARLPYLRDLGVDALWFNPWYPSPLADNGYDIVDYRAIDSAFGTLDEAEQLIAEARELGIRTIVDVVPNHVSSEHPWFHAALAARPGSAERARFWFRPGRGEDGADPPNGWQSIFGGSAWTRVEDGDWYLHLFAPEQPDLNWTHPDVWAEHEDVLRFWFDRGVAGVRIDSAALLVKDPGARRGDARPRAGRAPVHGSRRAARDLPRLARDRRRLRRAARARRRDLAARRRAARALPAAGRAAHRVQLRLPRLPLGARADARVDRDGARRARAGRRAADVGALEPRRHAAGHALRARGHVVLVRGRRAGTPTDLARGTRRARAAALLSMALPGSMYVYQGEELGLPEVEDIPADRRQDPMWLRSGGVDPGRDGCRVPLPWAGDEPPYGFSPDGATPWLDQPARLGAADRRGAERRRQSRCSSSTAPGCGMRRAAPWGEAVTLQWLPASDGVLAFQRGDRFVCLVNFGPDPVELPADAEVLIASNELARRCRPTRHHGLAPPGRGTGPHAPSERNPEPDRSRKGRTMKSIRMTTAVAVVALIAVCATAAAVGSTKKSVTISVASLIPGSTPAAIQQFNAQVAEFEKANPSIKVKPVEYQWTGPTFAAKLAAGTLPTVFEVPFTDARTLGDNGQLADLTALREGAAVLLEVQQGGPRRRHRLEGPDRRAAEGCLRAGAALQPQAVRAGGARSEQAADDVGAGRGRRARRSRRRPARPATSRWRRTTTPPAGS